METDTAVKPNYSNTKQYERFLALVSENVSKYYITWYPFYNVKNNHNKNKMFRNKYKLFEKEENDDLRQVWVKGWKITG
jgi:hypothetical protein